jgi:hypothetical protein
MYQHSAVAHTVYMYGGDVSAAACSLPGRGPVVRDAVQICTVPSSAPPHSTLPYMSTCCTHQNTYVLPEDGQEPRPKHVGAIINKNTVLQVGVNYCVGSIVARLLCAVVHRLCRRVLCCGAHILSTCSVLWCTDFVGVFCAVVHTLCRRVLCCGAHIVPTCSVRSCGTHETSVYVRHSLCQFPQNSEMFHKFWWTSSVPSCVPIGQI